MQGVDVVCNVAALVNYWNTYDFEPDTVDRVNHIGTKLLLQAAKKVRVAGGAALSLSSLTRLMLARLLNHPPPSPHRPAPKSSCTRRPCL